ncbi:glycosyltransferase family 4 protein [Mucilaginibacter sp.]|uniref:glycosyltransferase family 4 protein n=1 Tax=Mucilaginibacter sp. TaxID=1882438 RepID=UPI003AFFE381
MKILFLSHNFYPFIGGIEANSDILSRAFFAAGHEIQVLTWTPDPSPNIYPFNIIRNPSVFTLFKAHKWADLVFENNPCLRLAWPNLFFNHPYVIALNTWVSRIDNTIGLHGKIGIQDRIKFLWFKKASKVIAVSDAIRKHSFKPAIVIGNPYNAEVFRVIPEITKTKAFVFLGRLVPNKGVDQAIIAFKKLLIKEAQHQFLTIKPELTIIGEGPQKQKLENLVSELGLQEQVTFTGSVSGEKLARLLNQHRYMLVPSLWEEPFGNVVLEGMACGCVPVVSDGGGLPDAIGNAGISYKRGDVDALVDALINLIAHPDLEIKLRSAAPAHLHKHQPDIVSKKYLEVVEAAVAKSTKINP